MGKVTSLRTGRTSDAARDHSSGRDHLAHNICPIQCDLSLFLSLSSTIPVPNLPRVRIVSDHQPLLLAPRSSSREPALRTPGVLMSCHVRTGELASLCVTAEAPHNPQRVVATVVHQDLHARSHSSPHVQDPTGLTCLDTSCISSAPLAYRTPYYHSYKCYLCWGLIQRSHYCFLPTTCVHSKYHTA